MTTSRFPHPLALLTGCILLAALLTYILPAGEYERRDDQVTGRSVVVAGTYHHVEARPVGFFQALLAIPKGMADAASVIFLVFLVGGAFTVVDETGALKEAVAWLVGKLQRRETLVIPIISLTFALGGALQNMQEEIIALIPVLLLLTRRLGFNALTAVAMSLGAAAIGSSFSPINPFQVVIAQNLAQLPLLSGYRFRLIFLFLALAIWIWGTIRYARRTRTEAEAEEIEAEANAPRSHRVRKLIVLILVIGAFGMFVYGLLRLGWYLDEMSALFFLMGVLAGLIGGLGVGGTAESFVNGFRSMAFAGLLIGFARAIFIVLDEGKIIDTLVNAMVAPLGQFPATVSALGMMIVHTVIHVPVPSVSGQAVLTMPVLVPLSDLLGLSRQVTVLAYQYGAGLCELLTPTNGALMAIIAAARVRYDEWLKFAIPLYLVLFALGVLALITSIAIGLM